MPNIMRAEDIPDFKDLPSVQGMPQGCAWGIWDKNGERDHVGSLNLLTPEIVLEAKREIQTGVSVSLNWPLHNVEEPGFMRRKAGHKLVDLKPHFVAHDDELHINTQSGSQWDGLRHWAHQDTGLYYNGLKHTEISGLNPVPHNGIDQWSKRGGIVGRAVLIDYASWAEQKGIQYSAISRHCISENDLDEIAKDQGVHFRPGDILIVRSGWVKWYNNATASERIKGAKEGHEFIGVEGTESSIEWLHIRLSLAEQSPGPGPRLEAAAKMSAHTLLIVPLTSKQYDLYSYN
ncbi:MAG: hypothetical protein M1830_000536 [Pleopsidium flavum]|nr:MAG: hypothetical protein M1830_000536 [Pleopsidium flavum]